MNNCGANLKKGGQCKGKAMPNGRCRLHGGLTPAGIASPNFQTGRYSKYLPQRMLERYSEAQADPELIALREDVALVDARLGDLLKQVDTGESGALWAKLDAAFEKYSKFKDRADKILDANAAFNECEHLIQAGVSDRYAWAEVSALIEQRRKLVESESKRLKDMQQMVTVEKAMALISALADSVRRNVTDRKQLAAIQSDLIRLTAGTVNQETAAA
jgi:Spy/CpxP family protein refolding chaperone